jgi:hypothetical protein
MRYVDFFLLVLIGGVMSHQEFFLVRKNSFLPDVSELKAKKYAIFSLAIHSHQVKKMEPLRQKFGMTHNSHQSIPAEL